ncbi:YkgJ family cysteine cluster protein [Candidatus Woesearchaeota archaeon]|nr:YkgJ family cysteine cluster protein [Candidatus Woesearchaeota archaeon]
MVNDTEARKLADEARDSISEYCFSECKAYCCRKGFLLLSDEEAHLISNSRRAELEAKKVIDKWEDGGFVLRMGFEGQSCPSLLDNKCAIHKHPQRPKGCKEFPLFFWSNDTVFVSKTCPAVRENMLYPYLARLKKMGYKIVYGAPKY